MPNKWQITALLGIAFAAFYLALVLGPPPSTPQDLLKLVSASITATTVSLTAFHLGLWRWMPSFLAPRPDINGTWRAKGVPWSKDGESIEAFDGFMFVKQHYFSMSMRLETSETCSELEAEQFTISRAGTYQLWATYFCEPHASASPNSLRPHYGAFTLKYQKSAGSIQLKGRYWIDGEVANKQGKASPGGSLVLYERRATNYRDFENATSAYAK
jgi:hypothetical protein